MCTVAAMIVAATGCSPGDSNPQTSTFSPAFESAIQEAIQGGASSEQLALLTKAAKRGELLFTELESAVNATLECLEDQGFHVELMRGTDPSGFPTLDYLVGGLPELTPEEVAAIGDECIFEHSYFVETAYATQPIMVELVEKYQNDVIRPGITACFDQYDIPYDANAPFSEIWDQSFYLQLENPNRKPGDGSIAGCLLSTISQQPS